jgi:hypothetical protein
MRRSCLSTLLCLLLGVACSDGSSSGGSASSAGGAGGSGAGGSGAGGNVVDEDGRLRLPIEVFGTSYTAQAEVELTDASAVASLYLRTHRLAFEDASTNPARGPKGSVRVNGGAWLGLTNDTVTCFDHEAAYGCLNGAYHTVRLTVPRAQLGELVDGKNTVEFRFEGTDGQSMGYRILELNFLDAAGQRLIAADRFAEDSPDTWTPPLDGPEAVAAGKKLWSEATLRESPISTVALRATCADCHAWDGRDLAYFNFTNWSIVARSEFHGLSAEEGEQIASYIRSLDLGLPQGLTLADLGRPWNPPYQPGPGLDDRPVQQWAAGAGIDAVLETDPESLAYLAEDGSLESLKTALSPNTGVNHRTLPMAIQFPDWNEWLPEVHPLDVFGPEFENDGYEVGSASPFDLYELIRHRFANEDLSSAASALHLFAQRIHEHGAAQIVDVNSFEERDAEGNLIMHIDGTDLVVQSSVGEIRTDREIANRALRHWNSVKQWEVLQEFAAEGRAQELYGPQAEVRSWLTGGRNVFELAPHRAAHTNQAFSHHTELVGKYLSTAWYQLQVTLNSGSGFATARLSPVDWNYQPNHISDLLKVSDITHPVRLATTMAELYEVFTNRTPQDGQWGFRQLHPVRFSPKTWSGRLFQSLDDETRAKLLTAVLSAAMDLFERYSPDDWSRSAQPSDNQVEPADYVPVDVTAQGLDASHHGGRHADCWFSMIPHYREVGVEEATLARMIDWGEQMWPNGDWAALRN